MENHDSEIILQLRAHHLMCYHGYSGKGYNEEFIRNMSAIKERLLADPQMLIQILASVDDICRSCPHLEIDRCAKGGDIAEEIKTRELDNRVLTAIGLPEGVIIKAIDAFKLVEENIDREKLLSICKDCEWLEIGSCKDKISNPFFG